MAALTFCFQAPKLRGFKLSKDCNIPTTLSVLRVISVLVGSLCLLPVTFASSAQLAGRWEGTMARESTFWLLDPMLIPDESDYMDIAKVELSRRWAFTDRRAAMRGNVSARCHRVDGRRLKADCGSIPFMGKMSLANLAKHRPLSPNGIR
jgi:hypothetical protein